MTPLFQSAMRDRKIGAKHAHFAVLLMSARAQLHNAATTSMLGERLVGVFAQFLRAIASTSIRILR